MAVQAVESDGWVQDEEVQALCGRWRFGEPGGEDQCADQADELGGQQDKNVQDGVCGQKHRRSLLVEGLLGISMLWAT